MTIEDKEILPEGWIETTLGKNSSDIAYGYTASSTIENVGPKMLRITDIQDNRVDWNSVPYCKISKRDELKYALQAGDLLFARTGATVGKSFLIKGEIPAAVYASYLIKVRVFETPITDFLSKFFRSPAYWSQIIDLSTGTGQPNVNGTKLKEILLPLPPLAEQIRITDKLDALLSRVDAGRERLERVPRLVKRFRQSVLSAAVSGELTREWRGGGDAEWNTQRADEVCKKVQSGGTPKEGFTDGGIPFIKVYNIVNQKINFDYKPQFITEDIHFGSMRKSIALPGDVLMNIVGPPLGKVAILTEEFPEWNFNQAITVFRPSEAIMSEWIYYILCAGVGTTEILNEMKGIVGQINISLSQCRAFIFPVPSIPEQAEIVRRVEALFALADRLEARAQAALTRYSRLTPALLAKAFRGELVPQDPTDEPASVLLERIRAQREEEGRAKKAPGRGRKPEAITPKAKARAGEPQSEPKRGRGRPRKVQEEDRQTTRSIPMAASAEEAMRLLQERARAEREGRQSVQAGLFGGE